MDLEEAVFRSYSKIPWYRDNKYSSFFGGFF